MSQESASLDALVERLGYRFAQPQLLQAALTHRSFANEKGSVENYERLEFLGDSLLGMVTAEWLFQRYPDRPEGELSKLKSQLVSARTLAKYAADRLRLGDFLLLGVGEARSGGSAKRSLLADALEAVFGAIHLDGGLEACRRTILAMLEEAIQERERLGQHDAKTRLQEAVQGRGWELPVYRVAAEEGPDHSKRFAIECQIQGEVFGVGEGRSKKAAEQRAAAEALDRLGSA